MSGPMGDPAISGSMGRGRGSRPYFRTFSIPVDPAPTTEFDQMSLGVGPNRKPFEDRDDITNLLDQYEDLQELIERDEKTSMKESNQDSSARFINPDLYQVERVSLAKYMDVGTVVDKLDSGTEPEPATSPFKTKPATPKWLKPQPTEPEPLIKWTGLGRGRGKILHKNN